MKIATLRPLLAVFLIHTLSLTLALDCSASLAYAESDLNCSSNGCTHGANSSFDRSNVTPSKEVSKGGEATLKDQESLSEETVELLLWSVMTGILVVAEGPNN